MSLFSFEILMTRYHEVYYKVSDVIASIVIQKRLIWALFYACGNSLNTYMPLVLQLKK